MENTGSRKYLFFAGGALFIMSMTLSSYGIATVTPRILSAFNAMQYYTLISLMASIGNLLFLPIAGKLIDTIGRKSLLLFGGLATLVSSIAAAACLLMYVMCPAVDKKPLPAIDWAGILNLFVITGSIMYISSFGPRQGWTTPVILVCYVLLIGGFFLFPRVEKRAVSPLVNLELFKNPVFVGTLMCTFMLVWYQSAMRNLHPPRRTERYGPERRGLRNGLSSPQRHERHLPRLLRKLGGEKYEEPLLEGPLHRRCADCRGHGALLCGRLRLLHDDSLYRSRTYRNCRKLQGRDTDAGSHGFRLKKRDGIRHES